MSAALEPDGSDGAVIAALAALLRQRPGATIAVPGGSTPAPILSALAGEPGIDWPGITVWPTDDRCVPADHPASNLGLLGRTLGATGATLHPLAEGEASPRFACCWLGMGADGHVASLFPNVPVSASGPAMVARITPDPLPANAPFDRLTLTLPALLASDAIWLVLRGADKRAVLDAALAGDTALPIGKLLAAATCPVRVFATD